MINPIQILFTGQTLDKEIVKDIPNGFHIDHLPFIETIPTRDQKTIEALQTISNQKAVLVITSPIAAEWTNGIIQHIPDWSIACMEGKTEGVLKENNWEDLIKYKADNSLTLAEQIASNTSKEQPIYYLGSNLRLEHLPYFLREQGYTLHEIEAYQTKYVIQPIQKKYNAIAFLSPSGVKSFFNQHAIDESTSLFAIGDTTGQSLQEISNKEVIISPLVNQKALFNTIYNYYQLI
ncbi:uroporphyrinogen-III synthase [Sediminibacterium sp.]|uniref:uroporphyrinogen-III synthase n=1 Tax=Sediminibacterium sp. TaxID=1917865 RepID=UPI00273667DD|nr:uroporphyrinogen-III synthase [Sediminibacterium sp.]MDP3392968.1 uroporphyrinogen-III synthase [Sediminibacterium sp.]MDP3567174.1 uroporphyrinogen-III synthase [Sediminibacterium sp.]